MTTLAQKAERRKRIADRVAKGDPILEIAASEKVSVSAIYLAMKAHGIKRKKPATPKPTKPRSIKATTMQIIARLQNTSDPISDIAADMNVTPQSIHLILQDARRSGIQFFTRRENNRTTK